MRVSFSLVGRVIQKRTLIQHILIGGNSFLKRSNLGSVRPMVTRFLKIGHRNQSELGGARPKGGPQRQVIGAEGTEMFEKTVF